MKSVPENICLSEELSHQIPWNTERLTPSRAPLEGAGGRQLRSKGSVSTGRWQTPLLFGRWQCSWQVSFCI